VQVILEATGVYHEAVTEALHAAGIRVCVVNPAQLKEFARGRAVPHQDQWRRRVHAGALWSPRQPAGLGTATTIRAWVVLQFVVEAYAATGKVLL
jgi:hypothetical protein